MNADPSHRIQSLPGNFFAVLENRMAALQAEGRDVIRLDIGSPDLPPAPHIIEALVRSACEPGSHGYQPHNGLAALRQAWAVYYRRACSVELDPASEILPLLGSKEGIFNLALAWLNPGDTVLVPDPGYMTYTRGAIFAGAVPFTLPLRPENGYQPDFDSVPAPVWARARLMWLNYPNNPTAAVASRAMFSHAVALAREHHLLLCHDAAYQQVTFDGYRAPSILEIPGAKDVAVEFNSLSKSHNMAGWRSGVVVGSAEVIAPLIKLKTNLDSGHFRPVLDASTAALTGDQSWLVARNLIYQERRDVVVAGLRRLGLSVIPPRAGIYVWSAVPTGWNALDFVTSALDCCGVSLTPGTVFGAAGEGFFRVSLTVDTPRLGEAIRRLETWRKE